MKKILLVVPFFLLAACGEEVPKGPQAWQQTDKHLNCQQLKLELNDAQFWNDVAKSKMEMGATDVLLPVSYMRTRASAKEALQSTDGRIKNLQSIYEIKGCRNPYAGMMTPPM